MKTLPFVWGFIAFSILGLDIFNQTETFVALQDFESNIKPAVHPEEFLPNWSANVVRDNSSRVFQEPGEGINGSKALGIQPIGSFNAQIYIKTTSKNLASPRISLQAKTRRNGSGNRPVYVFYSFSADDGTTFSNKQQIGSEDTFSNVDGQYREYDFFIPDSLIERDQLLIKLDVEYGKGSGSAARLFIDDFKVHGLEKDPGLEIVSVEASEGNTLTVDFNGDISLADGYSLNSFSLHPAYGAPKSIEIDQQSLVLKFSDYLYSNRYTLLLNHLLPGTGEAVWMEREHEFDLLTPTPKGAVLINELMPDPNPKGLVPEESGLPKAASHEYIELFNTTDKAIMLNGFSYNNGLFEDLTLDGGAYLILASETNKDLFTSFGSTAAVDPFRNLPNVQGQIVLADAFGNVVDSLAYSQSWFADQAKARGGWALERINPYLSCSDSSNWKASVSLRGGTPGSVNSVFDLEPDTRPFAVNKVQAVSGHEIAVFFSKTFNQESLGVTEFFLQANPLSIKEVYASHLVLALGEEMVHGQRYELQVRGLMACSGMAISEEVFAFDYDQKAPRLLRLASLSTRELKLYFDEPIQAQTAALPDNYLVNKDPDLVASAVLTDSSIVGLTLERDLALGKNYSLDIFNIEDGAGNISTGISTDFLLDDQLDTIVFAGVSQLDLFFKREVDSISTGSVINYSVDHGIGMPRSAFRDPIDLKLVHLVFDRDLPQNTQGLLTVENLKDRSGNYIHTHRKVFFQDNGPVRVQDIGVLSDSSLQLGFNKPLVAGLAAVKGNYRVNKGIGTPKDIMQIDPKRLVLIFQNKFEEGNSYELSIMGLRDVYGVEITGELIASFEFDLSAPRIAEARLLNPYQILLKMSEPVLVPEEDKVRVRHHEVDRITALNEQEFLVATERAMDDASIEILFLGLSDRHGNLADTTVIQVPNEKIYLGEAHIVKEDLIRMSFSAAVDPSTAFHPTSYRINAIAPRAVLPGEHDFVLLLSLEKELAIGDSVELVITTIKSRAGKENAGIVSGLLYDDGIQDIHIAHAQLIHVLHKSALDTNQTEMPVFSFKEQQIETQALFHQTDQRLLQVLLDRPLHPDTYYDLVVPQRTTQNYQKFAGSTRTVILDKSPPKLLMVEGLNEHELLVSFDEALDPILSLVTSFYLLDGQEPVEVKPAELSHQVILVFQQALEQQRSYELSVYQLEDRHRNSLVEESLNFVFDGPVSPTYKEVIINELMAAPQPGHSLPDTEYVELYNAGSREVFLGGLLLANSRSATVLPAENLVSGQYLILAPHSQKEAIEVYGRTLGLSHWPTLLNEGDTIKLLDRNGAVLDELPYTTANYENAEKAREGYSLELVNPYSSCFEQSNLKPSLAAGRGTPGSLNSVFDDRPDNTLPVLLRAFSMEGKTIVLEFSKRLGSSMEEVKIIGSPALDIQGWRVDQSQPFRLLVELKEPLKENRIYQISVDNLRDCAANPIDPSRNTAILKIPVPAGPGDILLNELLFNARVSGLKFVEIYNRSEKYISLANWKLANASGGEIMDRSLLDAGDLIIDPFSFLVFTSDAAQLSREYPAGKQENYIQLANFPSYPISGGTVVLLSPEEDLTEWFDYDEKLHHGLINDTKGISLERFSPDRDVNDPSNWHSASSSVGYATPGYKNSQADPLTVLNKGISIIPEVFVPDAPGEQNFTTINYEMDSPGFVATLRIYGIDGHLVKELCQNELWGSAGFYTWDGTNLSNQKVRPGYYIVWVQVINLEGQVENVKKTVVVGSKF